MHQPTLNDYMDDQGFDFNPETKLWEVETFGGKEDLRIITCTSAQAQEHFKRGDKWR